MSFANEQKRNLKNYAAISLSILGSQGLGFILVSSFLSFVYTEYLGVVAATVGVVLSIGIVIDGLSDFGMGIVMDRVQTKHGKAKHWFLWMAIPLALTTGLMFAVPAGAPYALKIIYLFIMYNIYCTALTATRLPANALSALISNDSKVRNTSSFLVAVWATLGTVITGIIINPVINAFGGGLGGYRWLSAIFGIATGFLLISAFFLTTEMKSGKAMQENLSCDTVNIISQIIGLLKNRYWIIQQGIVLGANVSFGFMMGTMSYFCMYVLKDMNKVGLMLMVFTIPMILGSVIALSLSRKVDAKNVNITGYIIAIAGSIIAAFWGLNGLAVLCTGLIVRQIGTGFSTAVDVALTARAVEYGEWKNGNRQDGLTFCGKSVIQKISVALASAILGFVLTATGYVGGQGVIAASAVSGISFMFLKVPLILSVIALIFSFMFNLTDGKVKQMQNEIAARKSGK